MFQFSSEFAFRIVGYVDRGVDTDLLIDFTDY